MEIANKAAIDRVVDEWSKSIAITPSGYDAELNRIAVDDLGTYRTIEGDARAERRHMTVAFITDAHNPFADKAAVRLAAYLFSVVKPDAFTFMNDDLEFANISRFENVRRRFIEVFDDDFYKVMRAYENYLAIWKQAHSGAVPFVMPSNHNDRLRDYLMKNAGMFGTWSYLGFIQELRRLGVLYFAPELFAGRYLHLNKRFSIAHGHGLSRGSDIGRILKTALEKPFDYQRSIVFGHFHRHAHVAKANLDGFNATAYAVGALCRLTPVYNSHVPSWNHGMAFVHYEVGDTAEQGHVENLLFHRRYDKRRRKWIIYTIYRGDEYAIDIDAKDMDNVKGSQYA